MPLGQYITNERLIRDGLRVLRDRLNIGRSLPPVLYGPDGRVVESSMLRPGRGDTVHVRLPNRFRARIGDGAHDGE